MLGFDVPINEGRLYSNPFATVYLELSELIPEATGEATRSAVLSFGIPCGEATLAQQTELILGDRSLEAEPQSVVGQAWAVCPMGG